MKKTVIRIACFIWLLCISLGIFRQVFCFKYSDGISQMTQFYKQDDNTIDVLFIGSSHAFLNFNNATLWEEYGIASYDLGGSVQPMWNSYYYLKEALKTQTPELIVLEGFGVTYDFEYSDDSRVIKNTYGMKWSSNKVEAIKASSKKERNIEFLLDFSQYHTRYTALQKGDFFNDMGNQSYAYNGYDKNWKGQCLLNTSTPLKIADVSKVDYKTELLGKTETYYRKIIELAQKNAIPIVVVVVPYALNEYDQSKYNTAKDIAEEYGVEFINCILKLDEIGLDLNSDYHDHCHMTAIGSAKFSSYIGRLLSDKYDISDRRGDSKYNSWNEHAKYMKQYINNSKLLNSYSLSEISRYLHNSNYWIVISADGSCNSSDENIRYFLEEQGIYDKNTNGIWLKTVDSVIWGEGTKNNEYYIRTSEHDFCIRHSADTELNELIVDNIQYKKVNNGLNVFIYDTQTKMIADVFGINKDDGYNIVR